MPTQDKINNYYDIFKLNEKRQRITKCVIKHKLKWRIFVSEKCIRLIH